MEKSNQNPMGTKPIASLIFTMGCPPIVSMFVQSMYNIVDSIFVAQLGENALTAVSLAAPIQYILLAVSVGVGVGINSYISRNLGADNIDEANNTVTHSMILALAHSILFIILGLLFIKPFFRIYANNDVIFADGCSYTYIVVLLSFSLFFQITFEKVFQAKNVVAYYIPSNRSCVKYNPRSNIYIWVLWSSKARCYRGCNSYYNWSNCVFSHLTIFLHQT